MKWKFGFWIKQNRSSSTFQLIFNFYIVYSIYLQRWVKKCTSVLYFLKNKCVWLHTLARETKVSNYKTCIELQNLAWKVKLSHKMNESRHNQYIKRVKLPFKTKNSNISFCFSNISCKQVVMIRQLSEFPPLWKTKVSSYHLWLKLANILWEQLVTIR